MAASNQRQKDQEMAQMLKARGQERINGRCAMCYNLVPVLHWPKDGPVNPGRMDSHVMQCQGPTKGRRFA